jgi:toxin secretion/phage lysis holin
MQSSDTYVLVSAKWILAFLLSFWLSVPLIVQTLVLCMGLDFATWIIVVFISEELVSDRISVWISKRVLVLILVAMAHIITEVLKLSFDLGVVVASAYIVNEVTYITENCANAGVPIPPALLNALSKARKITGRGVSPVSVVEKLEQTVITRPDGLGGTESVVSGKKVTISMKDVIKDVSKDK